MSTNRAANLHFNKKLTPAEWVWIALEGAEDTAIAIWLGVLVALYVVIQPLLGSANPLLYKTLALHIAAIFNFSAVIALALLWVTRRRYWATPTLKISEAVRWVLVFLALLLSYAGAVNASITPGQLILHSTECILLIAAVFLTAWMRNERAMHRYSPAPAGATAPVQPVPVPVARRRPSRKR
jgi:hypothetical protein